MALFNGQHWSEKPPVNGVSSYHFLVKVVEFQPKGKNMFPRQIGNHVPRVSGRKFFQEYLEPPATSSCLVAGLDLPGFEFQKKIAQRGGIHSLKRTVGTWKCPLLYGLQSN